MNRRARGPKSRPARPAGEGGVKTLGPWALGPVWAFVCKIEKLNRESPPHAVCSPMLPDRNMGAARRRLRGVGGLNLWRPWCCLPHMAARADFFSWRKRFDLFSEIKEIKRPARSPRLSRQAKPRRSLLNRTGSEWARFFAVPSLRIYFPDVVRGEGGLNPWRVLARTGGLAAQISPRNSEKLFVWSPHSRLAELLPIGSASPKNVAKFGVGGGSSDASADMT
jgi:hypothetical protein